MWNPTFLLRMSPMSLPKPRRPPNLLTKRRRSRIQRLEEVGGHKRSRDVEGKRGRRRWKAKEVKGGGGQKGSKEVEGTRARRGSPLRRMSARMRFGFRPFSSIASVPIRNPRGIFLTPVARDLMPWGDDRGGISKHDLLSASVHVCRKARSKLWVNLLEIFSFSLEVLYPCCQNFCEKKNLRPLE